MPVARRTRGVATAYAFGAAAAVVLFLSPLVLMVLGSLRRPGLPPPDGFDLVPVPARWENYLDVTTVVPLAQQLLNSVLIAAVAVPVTVLLASWAGFALVTAGRRMRWWLLVVSLVALLVPPSALWVPRVVMFEAVGLTDHTLVAAAPALMATTPFFVLLMALAYRRIPSALFDAAEVEGLSPYRTWRLVAFPQARAAAYAVGVLAFVFHWSNLVEPLLLLAREETWPASLGLRTLAAFEPTFYPLLLAASVLVTVPAVLAFVLVQRAFFVRTLGG
ncbi:MAG: carbohydrate ABC transporter permease [Nocardioidaceae bacterium]